MFGVTVEKRSHQHCNFLLGRELHEDKGQWNFSHWG